MKQRKEKQRDEGNRRARKAGRELARSLADLTESLIVFHNALMAARG